MISYAAKKAIARRRPSSPTALGSSYEEDILAALESIYDRPLVQTGLSRSEMLNVIWKSAAYYRKGYPRTKDRAKGLRDQIAKEMKVSDAKKRTGILAALLFMESITRERFPVLAAYLETGNVSVGDRAQAIKTAASNAATATAEHLKTVARETISDATGLVKSAAAAANDNLPWYLRPKLLIPVGLAAAALFYGGPLLRLLPKRREYRQNPVSPAAARQGRKRAKARARFETFHDRAPDREYTIPAVDTSELVRLGNALCIGYESDKWTGRAADYLHDFEDPDNIQVYSTADGKALIIAGDGLNVTNRGITG